MSKTTEEKIAELSVLVNDLKQKFPQMEYSMSEISNTLTREQMNIGMLTKQYDKLYEVVEDFKEIQFSVQKLNDDTKRFSDQIEMIKARVEEVIAKERNCDYIHQLNAQQHNKEPQKTNWTFEKIISIAPNIIAVISFVGYLCYLAFMDRVKSGGL